jgi:hypothetical protein
LLITLAGLDALARRRLLGQPDPGAPRPVVVPVPAVAPRRRERPQGPSLRSGGGSESEDSDDAIVDVSIEPDARGKRGALVATDRKLPPKQAQPAVLGVEALHVPVDEKLGECRRGLSSPNMHQLWGPGHPDAGPAGAGSSPRQRRMHRWR